MKILFVHEVSYEKKVVYEYQDFAERLVKMGHSVTVIDFDESSSGEYQDKEFSRTGLAKVRLINTPFINKPILKYLSGRRNYAKILEIELKEKSFEVVFLYSVFINGTNTIRLCKRYGIPVVYRVLDIYHKLREDLKTMIPLYFGEKYIYRNADSICVTNEIMSKYVEKMAGSSLIKERLKVLHHGVDIEFFRPQEKSQKILTQYQLKATDKIIVFIGTTYSFSGLDVLVRNFKLMQEKIPNLKFIIVGGGDLDSTLKFLVTEQGLDKQIILTGFRPYEEVPDFISCADVTVLPFYINDITKDIIPIKVLQYLACKRPIVSAPLPDVMRLFPEKVSGIIYRPIEKSASFILALEELLTDESLQQDLAQKGLIFIEKYFRIDSQMQKLEDLLRRTISDKRKNI